MKSQLGKHVLLLEIVFYLPPYHPKTYSSFRKDTDTLFKVQQYLVYLSAKNRIRLLGSYDPIECKCGEEDFYDEAHMKDKGVAKVFMYLPPFNRSGVRPSMLAP